jgi:hypothetical protein
LVKLTPEQLLFSYNIPGETCCLFPEYSEDENVPVILAN